MPLTKEPLLTTEELATMLQVTPRHIWNLQKENLLPAIKVGRVHRYNLDDVLKKLSKDATDNC